MSTDWGMVGDRDEVRRECAARVKGPGKFEGEALYAPYFYDLSLDGSARERLVVDCDPDELPEDWEPQPGDYAFDMGITDEDRAMFPELGNAQTATVWEDSQGFVYVTLDDPEAQG